MFLEWVQILSHCAFEEEGRLRDYGDSPSKSGEPHFRSTDVVDEDGRFSVALHESEESLQERGLACSSAPHHSDFHGRLHLEFYLFENRLEVLSVAESSLLEMNGSLLRPAWRQIFVRGEHNSLFLVKFGISLHSLYTAHGSDATDEQS